MAGKDDLRRLREGTVINETSKLQESSLSSAVDLVRYKLGETFPYLTLEHKRQWYLRDIVAELRGSFPEVPFRHYHDRSSMRPDGGILMLLDKQGQGYPILISEKKNQGTNDLRELEGKPRQAKGNAIERLGKNVIGFRTALLRESIFPFVCFGDGCDFAEDSSIIDRVVTIAMFGSLNEIHLHVEGKYFNRGSFYFKVEQWKTEEMYDVAYKIAEQSVYYYFSKYGRDNFEDVSEYHGN